MKLLLLLTPFLFFSSADGFLQASMTPTLRSSLRMSSSLPSSEGNAPMLSFSGAFGWLTAVVSGGEKQQKQPESKPSSTTPSSTFLKAVNAKRLRWYNSAIERAGREGNINEALSLLQDCVVAGVEPEDVTLLIAALSCITANRISQALSLLDVLRERGFTHSKVDVYAQALTAALTKNDIVSAAFLVEDARREVVYPHELRSIEGEWRKAGKFKPAF